jgi:hypothetical protein
MPNWAVEVLDNSIKIILCNLLKINLSNSNNVQDPNGGYPMYHRGTVYNGQYPSRIVHTSQGPITVVYVHDYPYRHRSGDFMLGALGGTALASALIFPFWFPLFWCWLFILSSFNSIIFLKTFLHIWLVKKNNKYIKSKNLIGGLASNSLYSFSSLLFIFF